MEGKGGLFSRLPWKPQPMTSQTHSIRPRSCLPTIRENVKNYTTQENLLFTIYNFQLVSLQKAIITRWISQNTQDLLTKFLLMLLNNFSYCNRVQKHIQESSDTLEFNLRGRAASQYRRIHFILIILGGAVPPLGTHPGVGQLCRPKDHLQPP